MLMFLSYDSQVNITPSIQSFKLSILRCHISLNIDHLLKDKLFAHAPSGRVSLDIHGAGDIFS